MSNPPPAGVRRTGHHGRPTPNDNQREYLRQLGLRALQRRTHLNLTKRHVATYLGWSHSKVGNVELGRVGLSVLDAIDLSEALVCRPGWLITGEGTPDV